MGRLRDAELRRPPASASEPTFVSAVDFAGVSSATVLHPKTFEYGEEIAIEVRLNELRFRPIPGSHEDLFWSGAEVRVNRQELRAELARLGLPALEDCQYFITAALVPRSLLWHAHAPLLPGYGEGDVDGAIARLAAGEIQLGEMPFDPFERDDGWLVARLGDPRRPHWDERVEEAGDGFLVANRKAREPRAWMFGLCPGNPTWAVEKVVQERLDFLDQAQGIAPRRAALEANIEPGGDAVDYQDLQQMAIGNLHTRPGTELTEAMLRAAAWLSVAGRRQGSWRRLKGALWRHFRHLFRDADQRRWYAVYGKRAIKGRAADQAAELLTKIAECWQDHLKVHPGCTLLPRNSRLTLEGLQRALSQEPRDLRQAACREMLRRCIGLRLAQA